MPLLRALAAVVALNLLAGCGLNGDFYRMRSSLVHEDVHAWMGPAAVHGTGGLPWQHQLTDDERLLRDLAYPLIEPPYDRNKFYSVLGEVGLLHRPWSYPDRAAYASQLFRTPHRSQTARYNKLIEDIRNDVVRLDPFFRAAHHVADLDRKRAKSLGYVSKLTAEERSNAMRRMEENKAIVRWVRESLHERAASYHLALERLVIAAPSPNAVEAERSLSLLHQRITSHGA
jgi:hypothetical protein